MSKTNGAVLLGAREMRLRLPPQHFQSLEALARRYGQSSTTVYAELLLADAIERAAKNTMMKHVLTVLQNVWACGGIR